jgi:uncharacterized YccA/Bax inhibitor family protein
MNETTQYVVLPVAAAGKWGGFSVAGYGALTVNEQLAIAGFIVGVLGTIINSLMNWYYKRKEDLRSSEEHAAAMAQITKGRSSVK